MCRNPPSSKPKPKYEISDPPGRLPRYGYIPTHGSLSSERTPLSLLAQTRQFTRPSIYNVARPVPQAQSPFLIECVFSATDHQKGRHPNAERPLSHPEIANPIPSQEARSKERKDGETPYLPTFAQALPWPNTQPGLNRSLPWKFSTASLPPLPQVIVKAYRPRHISHHRANCELKKPISFICTYVPSNILRTGEEGCGGRLRKRGSRRKSRGNPSSPGPEMDSSIQAVHPMMREG